MVRKIQKFSQQKGGQRGQTLSSMKREISRVSGGETTSFLLALLNSDFGKDCKHKILGSVIEPVVKSIGVQYKNSPRHEKSRWLSIISGLISNRREAEKMVGFPLDGQAWANSLKYAERHGIGARPPPPPQSPTKMKLQKITIDKIELHCLEESWPCPNRTLKSGEGVRYWRKPINHVYAGFLKKHPEEKISLTSFKKYAPSFIKKAKRWTDMCDICELGK